MKTKISKKALIGFAGSTALALVAVFVPTSGTVFAQNAAQDGVNAANPGGNVPQNLFTGSNPIFTTVVNVLLFIIGAISVIMLIIGGIRYTVSAGDSSNVTAAKNTIMYAIIGLIIAFLAFAIVNWVLGALLGNK
jgi:hypothetical protein